MDEKNAYIELVKQNTYIVESIVIWTHGISLHSILHFMMR